MLIVISPSKRLNFDPTDVKATDTPLFASKAKQLINILKKKSVEEIKTLMRLSDDLAELNHKRYKSFKRDYTEDNSKTALLAFTGDVYLGLDAKTLEKDEFAFAQDHLRILSGLYGLLRPLDAMQPYRLEMGTTLENKKGSNLYQFWGDDITKELNKLMSTHESKLLVNLASKEYFSAINTKKLKAEILDINFREFRNGKLMFLSFNAKKARGFMSRYIIKNKLTTKEEIKGFNYENYYFDEAHSTESAYTFIR